MFFNYDKKHQKLKENVARNPDTPLSLREVFEDENLARAVAEALGLTDMKQKTSLTRLNLLEKLDASGREIRSLEGLEFLNALAEADLSGNQISRLPDYTKTTANLYGNKDTLVFMDLSDNPVSRPDNLFSLDASENRRRFINTFPDAQNRFSLGQASDKVFAGLDPSPELVVEALSRYLRPEVKDALDDEALEALLGNLLLQFAAGKKKYEGKDIWKDTFSFTNGQPALRLSSKVGAFSTKNGKKVIDRRLDQMLSEDDRYLAAALAGASDGKLVDVGHPADLNQAVKAILENRPELCDAYVNHNGVYEKKTSFSTLTEPLGDDRERARLNRIADRDMKQAYSHYLKVRGVLENYLTDHPEKERAITKLIEKNDTFASDYIDQYLALQDNAMLDDKQRQTLAEAADAFEKFYEGYVKDVRGFFDQDLFNLEVEMKYIDMLEEARKDITE